MRECDQESKAMWDAIRKQGTKNIIDDLLNVGAIEPIPEAEGGCCRRHRSLISGMAHLPGGLEQSKRFKFCPECGRRLL